MRQSLDINHSLDSHSSEDRSGSNSNNKSREDIDVFDDDVVQNTEDVIESSNSKQKIKPKIPLLNFENMEDSPSRNLNIDQTEDKIGWWTEEGLNFEEAKEFDMQFYIRRIKYNEDGEIANDSASWASLTYFRMIWLTIVLLGLQFTWSLELSYGTPYLLSIGLSKSLMSLVWLAGPLSGLIMQPLIGVISDSSESPLGRRRPFLIMGCGFVLFALFSIGWTEELVKFLNGPPSAVKYIAVIAFYILDFAINTIQAASRALIVDVLPSQLQENGNAWAGRMIGLGNVIGYFMGYIDLVSLFPFLGDKQLKVLSSFACILLILTVGITCGTIQEKQYIKPQSLDRHISEAIELNNTHEFTSLFKAIKDIFKTIKHMPTKIWNLCHVQFYSWIGWFPFLFYSTSWVKELIPTTENFISEGSEDDLGLKVRVGSRAFVIYSIVSLFSSFILPYFCKSTIINPSFDDSASKNPIFNLYYKVSKMFPTLPQLFTFSLALFSILMLSTIFTDSVIGATIIIALCGISWSISMWAPFAMIGEFVHQKKDHSNSFDDTTEYLPLQDLGDNTPSSLSFPPTYSETGGNNTTLTSEQTLPVTDTPPLEAGMLLGIHNIFIVIPQFITAILASLLFLFIDSGSSFGIVLRIGGIASIVACYLSYKLWK